MQCITNTKKQKHEAAQWFCNMEFVVPTVKNHTFATQLNRFFYIISKPEMPMEPSKCVHLLQILSQATLIISHFWKEQTHWALSSGKASLPSVLESHLLVLWHYGIQLLDR